MDAGWEIWDCSLTYDLTPEEYGNFSLTNSTLDPGIFDLFLLRLKKRPSVYRSNAEFSPHDVSRIFPPELCRQVVRMFPADGRAVDISQLPLYTAASVALSFCADSKQHAVELVRLGGAAVVAQVCVPTGRM